MSWHAVCLSFRWLQRAIDCAQSILGKCVSIETVDAEVFVYEVPGGPATEPFLLRCRRSGGDLIDVYTKVTWQNCALGSLACEVLANRLARDIGFRVPEIVYVGLDSDFIESVRAVSPFVAGRMAACVQPAFGSVSVGNGYTDARSRSLEVPMETLAEIWAFDRLILNVDRRAEKPNCLTNGTHIVLIDHEKSLNCEFIGTMINPFPWASGEPLAAEQRSPHVFRPHIVGEEVTLARLNSLWHCWRIKRLDG